MRDRVLKVIGNDGSPKLCLLGSSPRHPANILSKGFCSMPEEICQKKDIEQNELYKTRKLLHIEVGKKS